MEPKLFVMEKKEILNDCTNLCLQLAVLWRLVDMILRPKSSSSSSIENKPPTPGVKWSFAAGTNLLSDLIAKIDRESKQKLNEFAKELRSFGSVDMSGMLVGFVNCCLRSFSTYRCCWYSYMWLWDIQRLVNFCVCILWLLVSWNLHILFVHVSMFIMRLSSQFFNFRNMVDMILSFNKDKYNVTIL